MMAGWYVYDIILQKMKLLACNGLEAKLSLNNNLLIIFLHLS